MEKVNFGVTKRGEEASLYVLENKNNTTIKVTDYGATLVSLLFADKAGVQKDLVLGYDNVTGYEEHISYFGAIIGRNGNRIKDSRFTINGKEYRIDENENHNNLHSGKNGFDTVIWEVREHTDNSITFYHYSSETEQKFPGNMEITVTYTIADDDTLHIVYNGKADADTVMNCTNHSYFNLNGHESGSIEGQVLQIFADAYTPVVDSSAIPTGEIASAEGTPMDFRTEKQIGQDIRADFEQLHFTGGYDHNYVLGRSGEKKIMANAYCRESGIALEAETDCCGVQFYAGNFIGEQTGKGGASYHDRSAFCLESQFYPNAVNEPDFPSPVVKAGDTYHTETSYRFYLR